MKSRRAILLSVSVVVLSLACQRKLAESGRVQLQLPQQRVSSSATAQSIDWGLLDPTSLSDITCYAVMVEVPDITPFRCLRADGTLVSRPAALAGTVPAGGRLELTVPSGPDRTILVAGFAANSTADCKNFAAEGMSAGSLSAPFIVAKKTIDVKAGDNDVVMQASFDSAAKFDRCEGFWNSPGSSPPTPILSVAVGASHTCAVFSDKKMKCWGLGTGGQLGLGSTVTKGDGAGEMGTNLAFVDVSDSVQVSAGLQHTCALLDGGAVKCWGGNGSGQLGLGHVTTKGTSPADMGANLVAVDLGTGRTAAKLVSGNMHSCALLDNGSVKCWGSNTYGGLGVGDFAHRGDGAGEMGDSLPAVDLGIGRTAIDIAAGVSHTCAVLDDTTVKCWGQGAVGKLGNGSSTDSNVPVVVTGLSGVSSVRLGGSHSCALKADGTVHCWGYNVDGQLGDGTTTTRTTSIQVLGLTGITKIAVGGDHTCAVDSGGSLKCWGANASGQLGINSTTSRDTPTSVALSTTISGVFAKADQTCATIRATGELKCWGANTYGGLGVGDTVNRGSTAGSMLGLPSIDLGLGSAAAL